MEYVENMTEEKKYDAKLPLFNDDRTDDHSLWSLPLKTALNSRTIAIGLSNEEAGEDMKKKALSIVLNALKKKPLRTVQDCEKAKIVWKKLESRNAGKTKVD